MADGKIATLAYPRLCIAYFCEFAIWAAWAGTLSVFAGSSLGFTSNEVAWLYCAIPFGAIIGPLFIGPLADRYFAAQKVISVLHFFGGIALLACGYLCHTKEATFPLLMTLLLLSGICYMPTQGLLNSIVFKNLSRPSMGPYVFVFGTIGWIISCLLIAAFFGGEKSYNFFFVGGGFSIFLAIYSLTLPNTPPKGIAKDGVKRNFLVTTFGLDAFKLFKDPAFALFAICVFFATIPACGFYFVVQTPYLSQMGYPSPVALGTLNQFSEIFFMTALSVIVVKVGLKAVLLLGMFAWIGRYLFFALPGYGVAPEYDFVFSVIGLLFHGFSYSFLYVGAYMYAEKKAPENLKASVQSMMIFLLLGVGQVLGAQIYPPLAQNNKPVIEKVTVSVEQLKAADGSKLAAILEPEVKVPIPAWKDAEGWIQYLDLAEQTKKLMGIKDAKGKDIDLGSLLPKDQPLTAKSIEGLDEKQLVQDGIRIQYGGGKKEKVVTVQYKKEDLKKICEIIAAGKQDYSLTRKDWLAAQSVGWKNIFTIPAAFIGIFFLIFLIFGQSPKDEEKDKDKVKEKEETGITVDS
ncbi:MAG: MFS transporter [Planctomycetaceae bacterium]|jgi:nucleoside transporter|nr:MFS transporter [Planctomycetaceae bacterium]